MKDRSMTAVDTNIVVYTHREDPPGHGQAYPLIRQEADGRGAWPRPRLSAHEFLGIATRPWT